MGRRSEPRRLAWHALVLASAIAAAGCHTYTPVTTPAPGATVRVHIPLRSALDNPNAPTRTTAVEGQVVEAGDTIVLAVRSRREFGAFREIVQYDTLRLGPEQRQGVEVREFSNGKSIALGVVLTGAVAGAALTAFGGGGGGGQTPDPPPPPPAIVSRALISSLIGLLTGN